MDDPCKGNVGFIGLCMRGYRSDGWEISGYLTHFAFLDTLEPTNLWYEVRKDQNNKDRD